MSWSFFFVPFSWLLHLLVAVAVLFLLSVMASYVYDHALALRTHTQNSTLLFFLCCLVVPARFLDAIVVLRIGSSILGLVFFFWRAWSGMGFSDATVENPGMVGMGAGNWPCVYGPACICMRILLQVLYTAETLLVGNESKIT